jgi:hypothetical protein
MLNRVIDIIKHITLELLGVKFNLIAEIDKLHENGRIYLQLVYYAPCTKTQEHLEWKSRKWYLSEFMTDDEIVKTAYCAFEAAVKHEIMEGFKFDGVIVFNPHVNFRDLLAVSHNEIKRTQAETATDEMYIKLNCIFDRLNRYAIPLKMPKKDYSTTELIRHCTKNSLFKQDGDEDFVSDFEVIEYDEYLDLVGEK